MGRRTYIYGGCVTPALTRNNINHLRKGTPQGGVSYPQQVTRNDFNGLLSTIPSLSHIAHGELGDFANASNHLSIVALP